MPSAGKIYLIPTFLGEDQPEIIAQQTRTIVEGLDEFIVENARTARRFLRAIGYRKNFDSEVIIRELDKHAEKQDCEDLLQNVLAGKNCGLLSEAGNPCIADPGGEIVAFAHRKGIEVIPLVGPSSILLALIASGFNGQQFCFNGYLPVPAPERIRKIKQLETRSSSATQVLMETPFRNQKLFEDIINNCGDETLLCVACNLTLPSQFIKTTTIAAWRKSVPELHKRYCIFLLGR